MPAVRWPEDDRPPVDQFLSAVAEHGGGARVIRSRDELAQFASDVIDEHGISTVVATTEPVIEELAGVLVQRGVELREFDGPSSAAADLGITGAMAGIARTGTVVVDGSAGRSPSLLPEVHLVLVAASDIVETPAEVWRTLPDRFDGRLPSQVVLVTGPSKSADIEGVLTVGVHGPRAVWIGVLTD
ncbi:MAG: LUD domain-containing protein [Nitriliruptorales bacterium]|nr:LUD domain-containing protein [Nitriliruptorales bacterium]